MDFEIITTVENARIPVTVLFVYGKIDSANAPLFQAKAEEAIEHNDARHILVDLENVPFMSSAGLRVLHTIFNKLRAIHQDVNDDDLRKKMSAGVYKSPYLKVCGASAALQEVFEIGGFDVYINVFANRQKALDTF